MTSPRTLLFLVCLFCCCTISVTAQTARVDPTPTPTPKCEQTDFKTLVINPYKIKAAQTVSSATARRDDYVLFTLMEDVYSMKEGHCDSRVLIASGTAVYGRVIKRKHRHFPLVKGKLEIELLPIKVWDGTTIIAAIRRHLPDEGSWKDTCKTLENSRRAGNCIAGRRNAGVAIIVPAVAATGGGAVSLIAEDKTAQILGATAFFTLAEKVGDLLNGTDAQVTEGEIFDMHLQVDKRIPAPVKKPE